MKAVSYPMNESHFENQKDMADILGEISDRSRALSESIYTDKIEDKYIKTVILP